MICHACMAFRMIPGGSNHLCKEQYKSSIATQLLFVAAEKAPAQKWILAIAMHMYSKEW